MAKKPPKKNLGRKQMKKTRGGAGGQNQLTLEDTPGGEPTPANGHVKVFSSHTEFKA